MEQLRKFLSSVEDENEDDDEGLSSSDDSDEDEHGIIIDDDDDDDDNEHEHEHDNDNDNSGHDSDLSFDSDPPVVSSSSSNNIRGTTPLLLKEYGDVVGAGTGGRDSGRDSGSAGGRVSGSASRGIKRHGNGNGNGNGNGSERQGLLVSPGAQSAAAVAAAAASTSTAPTSAFPSPMDHNKTDYINIKDLRDKYKNKLPISKPKSPSLSPALSPAMSAAPAPNIDSASFIADLRNNYKNVPIISNRHHDTTDRNIHLDDYESSDDDDDEVEKDDMHHKTITTNTTKTNMNTNTNTYTYPDPDNQQGVKVKVKVEPTTSTTTTTTTTSTSTSTSATTNSILKPNINSASYIADLKNKYKNTNTSKNKPPNRSFNQIIRNNLKQNSKGTSTTRSSGGGGGGGGVRRSSVGYSSASSANSDGGYNNNNSTISNISNNSIGGRQNSNSLFATEEIYGDGGYPSASSSAPVSTMDQTNSADFRPYSRSDRLGASSLKPPKGGGIGGFSALAGRISSGSGGGGGASTSTPNTFEREHIFLNLDGSSMGDTMAAAAAVVRNGYKSQKHFKKGEKVLIALPVLSDEVEPRPRPRFGSIGGLADAVPKPSVAPVNKYGYPKGEGKTPEERQEPHVYVLATVKHIHFREDARHYTVERADTGVCVRADTGWMEPIQQGSDAEIAAWKASQIKEVEKTPRRGSVISNVSIKPLFVSCAKTFSWMGGAFKKQAAKIVSGSDPYRCEFSITTVNFLVMCSLIVAFLDQTKHAFFCKDADFTFAIVMFVAWIILVIELIFQVLIRPKDYQELLQNEQAYNPCTVRYIDSFHLFFEATALLLAVPDFLSIFGTNVFINSVIASIYATTGNASIYVTTGNVPTLKHKYILGYLYFFTTRLRLFCLVRYKRNHWINAYYFDKLDAKRTDIDLPGIVDNATTNPKKLIKRDTNSSEDNQYEKQEEEEINEDDELLLKAAKIGTALLLVNSHRILIFLLAMTLILPFIASASMGGPNESIYDMTKFLHQINIAVPNNASEEDCKFFNISVDSWLAAQSFAINRVDVSIPNDFRSVVRARLYPSICNLNDTPPPLECHDFALNHNYTPICNNWTNATIADMEKVLNARQNSLVNVTFYNEGRKTEVIYNLSHTVSLACLNTILLQFLMLTLVLLSLGYLRSDANQLVIMPLRRMLRIVLRYASNPLAATPAKKRSGGMQAHDSVNDFGVFDLDFDSEKDKDKLGSYETEQLITAVAKITDLLRKCWGVAGAGIISSNLARNMKGDTVVFNPTMPGKLVYALFGFAGINDFGHLLRSLDKDVMTLINDIAIVIHNEVYRWGLGDSGQCNKNNGATFLMVYRIGDFDEVSKKNDQAKKVIFAEDGLQASITSVASASSRALIDSKRNSIQLASLPGVNAFGDRALLGLLKSFAGINRAKSVKLWERDYRVGGGVGAFSVGMSFGMHAGWAVEGAVGSSYKIDATYLSPTVNMASRMMSACKQYRLAILLSQAVEELLSKECRSKLRHVDTVYVKGSKDAQRIYTYDARQKGVPFFLNMRTDEQADKEAKNYTPKIWRKDQDLQDMRSHVSQEFITTYNNGLTQYLTGHWENAVVKLKEANEIMITDVVAGGRIEFSALTKEKLLDCRTDDEDIIHMREEYGDGPCHALISYMENRNCIPPSDWNGVRSLTSK